MLNSFLYSAFEQNIIIFIQSYLIGLTPFFVQVGILADNYLIEIMILIIFWSIDKNLGKLMGLSYSFNAVLTPIFKITVLRKRPYFINSNIKCLQAPSKPSASIFNIKSQGYSFPSGHSSSITALYGSIVYYLKNKYVTVICAVIILTVGFSRIFLGVHFPSDVIGGLILGFTIIVFISFLFNHFKSNLAYLILFLCFLPCVFLGSKGIIYKLFLFLSFEIGFIFEEKFVKFEKAKNISQFLLRIIFGIIIYVILTCTFNMQIFNSPLLKIISTVLTYFILIGIYPLIFKNIFK